MDIALDEVVYFDAVTHHPTTGAVTDADSTPTFAVYEEATDTDIGVGGNLTKRTSLTGNYRGTFTLSAANGFEVGKWYSIIGSATVNSVAGKGVLKNFRVVLAESVVGEPKVDVGALGGVAQSATDLKDFADTGYDPATHKVAGVVLTDTLTTYTGNTVQTGDSFARIGANGVGLTSVALVATGLDAITATDPGGVASTFPQMVVQLWRRFFKKVTKDATDIKTYANDGTTVRTTQAISDDGTTQTQGTAT